MKHRKIEATLEKKISKVGRLSAKVSPDFDADVIHDFRVAVKSLRALVRMLVEAQGGQFRAPKKFRRLYHVAGAIRQAQLELEKLDEMQLDLPGYRQHLHASVDMAKHDWTHRYREKAIALLESRISQYNFNDITAATVKNFVNAKMLALHGLCTGTEITDEMMHGMRKLVKDIMYVLKAVIKEAPHLLAENTFVPIPQLEYCAGLLGDYNDARIMLSNMHSYTAQQDGERQVIENLYNENIPKLHGGRNWIIGELLSIVHQHTTVATQIENVPHRSIPVR